MFNTIYTKFKLFINGFYYKDAPSTSRGAVPTSEDPGPASLVQAFGNVENEKEIGIWTNPKTKMVHSNVVPHQPLPFTRKYIVILRINNKIEYFKKKHFILNCF